MKLPSTAFSLLCVFVLVAGRAGPAAAQSRPFTVNIRFPVQIGVFVPCANGGAGEGVILTGILHEQFHVTEFADGTFFLKIHDQPQNIKGVGDATGAIYMATGVTQSRFKSTGRQTTFINNFRIIGQGRGNNFLVQQLMHVTVNANGQITAEFDGARVDCK
jgi:hypothetical protein